MASPAALLLLILLLAALGLYVARQGLLVFSPGELTAQTSRALTLNGAENHADIEAECRLCHQPFERAQDLLCLDCHTEVADQQAIVDGLHGQLEKDQTCRACHSDHHGRTFDPNTAARAQFDHESAEFSLVRHSFDYSTQPLDCQGCHIDQSYSAVADTVCADCHSDQAPDFMVEHRLNYGPGCLACHDGLDRMTTFDHAATHFPLEGRHAETSCSDCHTGPDFSGQPLTCEGCHSEPPSHKGQFSNDCQACHSATSWTPALLDGLEFDHAGGTNFSLVRHELDYQGQVLNCGSCHGPDVHTFPPLSCESCHRSAAPDFMNQHVAQFGVSCLSCHDGSGRLTDFDHDQVFVLDGRHAEIGCSDCHLDQTFAGTPTTCTGCHTEPAIHAGVFGLECQVCHATSAWSPAALRSHTFPLDHGDQGVIECLVCHSDSYLTYTCDACHDPIEMQEEHVDEDILDIVGRCADCHPTGREDEAEGGG